MGAQNFGDLRQDRDRDLRRGAGPDVESHRRVDARQRFVVEAAISQADGTTLEGRDINVRLDRRG